MAPARKAGEFRGADRGGAGLLVGIRPPTVAVEEE